MTQKSKITFNDAPRQLPRQLLVRLQNIAHRANRHPLTKPIARLIEIFIHIIWHAHLPPAARISPSAHFGHNGLGVILNPLCEIGANCLIGPHVVMGGRAPIQGAPLLGKNITVHSGAKLIGPISIGDGSVIGANAVVTKDLPSNCVAAGVRAQIVKTDINPSEYR